MNVLHRNMHVWRRLLVTLLVTGIAMLAYASTMAPAAQAIVNPSSIQPSYTDWGYVQGGKEVCLLSYPPRCSITTGFGTRTAWRWNSSSRSWSMTLLSEGTRVYIHPFSSPWHWVWTSRTGWLAMQARDLENGYRCTGPSCPIF